MAGAQLFERILIMFGHQFRARSDILQFCRGVGRHPAKNQFPGFWFSRCQKGCRRHKAGRLKTVVKFFGGEVSRQSSLSLVGMHFFPHANAPRQMRPL